MSLLDTLAQFQSVRPAEEETSLSLENMKNRFNFEATEQILAEFKLLGEKNKVTAKDLNDSRIPKIVKDYFGIKLKLRVFNDMNAGVPFTSMSLGASSKLLDIYSGEVFDNNGKLLLKKAKHAKIGVNIETGMISGVESLEHVIYMGTPLMGKRSMFTPEMACAVFLHELGHIWTYYLTLPHFFLTNMLMGEYTDKFLGIQSKEAKMVLVKETERELGFDILEKERLTSTESSSEAALILYTSHVGSIKSLMGVNPYDARNAEAMADQFVIRMGMGKDLAEVNKLWAELFGSPKKGQGAVGRLIFNILTLPYVDILSPLLILISAATEYSGLDALYDNPVRRNEVVLHGLRDRYKEAPPKEKNKIMKEISQVEKWVKENTDYESIFDIFMTKILPWGRTKQARINFSKALESLANNSLTTRADKLKNVI